MSEEGKEKEKDVQFADDGQVHDSTTLLEKSPQEMYKDYMQSHASIKKKELPRMAIDDPHYSSTLVMLKRTRAEVEDFASDLSVISTIADLPVSADVRRTVAKIFADPRNAEAISEQEWKRREHAYQTGKDRLGEQISDHVKREKDTLRKEMAQLGE